ncbi:hypothetical protein MKY48_16245 [Paenibacillus sp. FSL W8-0187]|uniref:hypothetical protein n=1 Tax=Paenibacillus sp. FSL W8-0187 TaxID=2921710 RepID=UPI0012B7D873|nr:hypothetical protein [Paenibacillus xylanexedens]
MNPEFESNTNKKPWLENNNKEAKERIYRLGKKAVDSLIKDSMPISYRNIAARSKQLDISGQGIHPNSVKNNDKLYAYYQKYSNFKAAKSKTKKIRISETDYTHIKIDRDVQRVKGRYMKMSKLELVELLIQAEQYIAEQNKIWIKTQFESFK